MNSPNFKQGLASDLRTWLAHLGASGRVAAVRALCKEGATPQRAVQGHRRRDLELRALGGATIRPKLSALSSLFDALWETNAVHGNPVDGMKGQRSQARKARRR
jgi:site-specific recombinase XerC